MSTRNQSINDTAVEALMLFQEAKTASDAYNDFGSCMGIRDEIQAIENDFDRALSSIIMRSLYLKTRIAKWEKNDKEVGKLGDQ